MMATAPMPRASVDTPTSAVSRPHTMNKALRKSMWERILQRCRAECRVLGALSARVLTCRVFGLETCLAGCSRGGTDRDADLDANCRRVRRADSETKPRAVGDTGGHQKSNRMAEQ